MSKVFITADIGVNANGDMKIASKLIESAIESGVDGVKFQHWGNEYIRKCGCRNEINGLNFTDQEIRQLKSYTEFYAKEKDVQVEWFATPFDNDSFEFLNTLDMNIFKIPSNIYVWDDDTLIDKVIHTARIKEKRLFVSMGLVESDKECYFFDNFNRRSLGYRNIIYFHCISKYPTPLEDIDLQYYDGNIGYSDHSGCPVVPIAAAARGAKAIEVHLTLNKDAYGPDHKASLNTVELRDMVNSIRIIEQIV
jgi:sialic acid synthase SpsE